MKEKEEIKRKRPREGDQGPVDGDKTRERLGWTVRGANQVILFSFLQQKRKKI